MTSTIPVRCSTNLSYEVSLKAGQMRVQFISLIWSEWHDVYTTVYDKDHNYECTVDKEYMWKWSLQLWSNLSSYNVQIKPCMQTQKSRMLEQFLCISFMYKKDRQIHLYRDN